MALDEVSNPLFSEHAAGEAERCGSALEEEHTFFGHVPRPARILLKICGCERRRGGAPLLPAAWRRARVYAREVAAESPSRHDPTSFAGARPDAVSPSRSRSGARSLRVRLFDPARPPNGHLKHRPSSCAQRLPA
mmetsp:Transcript_30443/g.94286  ORF Transcript_30443/g.94286 Transcript_30443/m.94286 type:complete len:135 (-) Transcript_30443:158-562(-)